MTKLILMLHFQETNTHEIKETLESAGLTVKSVLVHVIPSPPVPYDLGPLSLNVAALAADVAAAVQQQPREEVSVIAFGEGASEFIWLLSQRPSLAVKRVVFISAPRREGI